MITTITSVIKILTNIPAVIGIVRLILDILGSEKTVELFDQIKKVIEPFKDDDAVDEIAPIVIEGQRRKSILEKVKERLGIAFLDLTDDEYKCVAGYHEAKKELLTAAKEKGYHGKFSTIET
jgi:hypothetical protein